MNRLDNMPKPKVDHNQRIFGAEMPEKPIDWARAAINGVNEHSKVTEEGDFIDPDILLDYARTLVSALEEAYPHLSSVEDVNN